MTDPLQPQPLSPADRAVDAELQALFGPIADEPVPERLVRATRRPPSRRIARAAAAAIAIFMLGGGLGWLAHDRIGGIGDEGAGLADLARGAAMAHRVFAVEVRHPVEVGAADEGHLVTWLSRRLGTAVRPPPLGDLGYHLVGGRLLPGERGPAAQFMYENASGERLTLYATTSAGTAETAFRFLQDGDTAVFYWLDRDVAYALIGTTDRARLLPVARKVYERLDR